MPTYRSLGTGENRRRSEERRNATQRDKKSKGDTETEGEGQIINKNEVKKSESNQIEVQAGSQA